MPGWATASLAGKLVGFVSAVERRDTPRPKVPTRPVICSRCGSADIHGERPCPKRRDLEDTAETRTHDWHCHACDWSAKVGDRRY